MHAAAFTVAALAGLLCACAGPAQQQGTSTGTKEASVAAKQTLIVLMNDEPKKLGAVGAGGGSL